MNGSKYIKKRIGRISSELTKELDRQKEKIADLKKQADEYEKIFREMIEQEEAEEEIGKD